MSEGITEVEFCLPQKLLNIIKKEWTIYITNDKYESWKLNKNNLFIIITTIIINVF